MIQQKMDFSCGWDRDCHESSVKRLLDRERIGAMSLLMLFAQRMGRIFDMHFSIVRHSVVCASRKSGLSMIE